jgi:general secretion pathway protein D
MLLRELDRPVDSTESPIQFYKLKNANAIEVLYSLLALQQAAGSGQVAQGGLGYGQFGTLGGLNVGGVAPGGILPVGFGGDTGGQSIRMPFNAGNAGDATSASTMQNQNNALSPLIGGGVGGLGTGVGGIGTGVGGLGAGVGGLGAGGGQVATLPGGARVSADVATNSLIVFAPASVQPLYEKLIRSLDQRRPQVLIEAEIVAVDTSDNFSLGVEISIGDRTGTNKLFKFTSFGLSQVDPTNGMLTPIPSLGFNGVLLDPEVADVIVQALSTHTRSRVLASPKILVNDNQTGTLESVASVPFRSINTINTISSESLGGDQQAGTIITVTPHINEDDHLQLEFEVEFSTFTGQGGADLPPPRQIDRVGSVVTIPDGKTVVVGGLKRIGESETFTGVPWTEKIPVLRELTSLSTGSETTTSFFLFIRPKILRDSRFRDLRYLSDIELQDAQIQGDFPESRPIVIPCLKPPTQTVRYPNSVLPR